MTRSVSSTIRRAWLRSASNALTRMVPVLWADVTETDRARVVELVSLLARRRVEPAVTGIQNAIREVLDRLATPE